VGADGAGTLDVLVGGAGEVGVVVGRAGEDCVEFAARVVDVVAVEDFVI
jgi:hypothetical protein